MPRHRAPGRRHWDALADVTQINMFFGGSTAPRPVSSLAGKRLGADVMSWPWGASSLKKGETLIDTALTLNAMRPDLLVVRHPNSGRGGPVGAEVTCAVLNAGRRAARTSDPGAAGCADDPAREGPAAPAHRGDLRRHRAFPRGPVEHSSAGQGWRTASALSVRHPDARGRGGVRRGGLRGHGRGAAGCRRGDDAAPSQKERMDGGSFPVRAGVFPPLRPRRRQAVHAKGGRHRHASGPYEPRGWRSTARWRRHQPLGDPRSRWRWRRRPHGPRWTCSPAISGKCADRGR